MANREIGQVFEEAVEADETYAGGKPGKTNAILDITDTGEGKGFSFFMQDMFLMIKGEKVFLKSSWKEKDNRKNC
jgi:hypothetical protein